MTMKAHSWGLLLTAVLAAYPLCSETRPRGEGDGAPLHVHNSFQLVVSAPYRETASMFGANGERSWAQADWDPRFLYPQPGTDMEGAVFTVQHGLHKSVWVNTVVDLDAKHLQYVYFIPDVLVTTIDINFQPLDSGQTRVSVAYARTALVAGANDHVRMLGEKDRGLGKHWQEAINNYLQRRKP